jgi:lysophospholipase L1-like esterase
MRRILIAVLFLATGSARLHAGEAEGRLQQGDYVAVLGDSMPVVYGRAPIAPQLYSNFIEAYLLMCKPAADLSLTQFGFPGTISYNYATYLMANDLLPFQPTAAAVWFGMGEGGWSPMDPDKAKRYRDGLTAIVRKMKKANVRLIALGTPICIDGDTCNGGPDRANMYSKTLAAFRDIARDVAREEGVPFANIFDLMMDVAAKGKAKYGKPYTLVGDGNIWSIPRKGHLVMAYAFLKALGCDGDIGTITVDLAAGKAEATKGHKVLSTANGRIEIESSRYPFCFGGAPARAAALRGVIEFFPFNDDLNRFRLVVRNIAAEKAAVTWGAASKEFSAAQLARGINLAAEFPDNPFCEPFARVEEQILQQQKVEAVLINDLMHRLPTYVHHIPAMKDLTDQLAPAIAKKSKEARDATAAAVKPVTHTIKILPVK